MITLKELHKAFTLGEALQIIREKNCNLFLTRMNLHFIAMFIYLELAQKSHLLLNFIMGSVRKKKRLLTKFHWVQNLITHYFFKVQKV